jgi:hypothetical protein
MHKVKYNLYYNYILFIFTILKFEYEFNIKFTILYYVIYYQPFAYNFVILIVLCFAFKYKDLFIMIKFENYIYFKNISNCYCNLKD